MAAPRPDAGFWSGKRVLVTGHTGFKGGWLSLWLQMLGADVCGFAMDPPTKPSLFEVAAVGRGMRSEIGDVRDAERVAALVREVRPDVVFHLAAQPLVRRSYVDPIETYTTNVIGTLNVFEAVRRAETTRSVVNVTSDKCYENREWIWGYRENDPMGGFDPYSSSKGCSELLSDAYRRSYFAESGIALASVRAGNVIGGGDWAVDRLVPDILRAIDRDDPILIRNPRAIRPWQHVLESLSAYLLLAEKLHGEGLPWAEGWNIGPQDTDARPVAWIVDRLVELWGHAPGWRLDGEEQPHEAHHLKLDTSKIAARLGWAPRWSLGEALVRIVEWHKAHTAAADMRAVCIDQINHYVAR